MRLSSSAVRADTSARLIVRLNVPIIVSANKGAGRVPIMFIGKHPGQASSIQMSFGSPPRARRHVRKNISPPARPTGVRPPLSGEKRFTEARGTLSAPRATAPRHIRGRSPRHYYYHNHYLYADGPLPAKSRPFNFPRRLDFFLPLLSGGRRPK